MPANSAAVGRVLAHGASDAQAQARAQGTGPSAGAAGTPAAGGSHGADSSGAPGAASSSAPGGEPGIGKKALAKVGAVFGAMTSAEQSLSTLLSGIPMPAFPAARITDTAVGIPHAHSHPPNLIPPAPPVPLPATGPIIKIPFVSGADKVLINNLSAARCGDMGVNIWCGGFFPFYEIFLGSSSVWIEGQRAARLGVDITKHCVFSTPKPNDLPLGPMIGAIVTASPNVIIGGVPLPSLTNLAVGLAFKAVFSGIGKIVKAVRAAKAAAAAKKTADFRRIATGGLRNEIPLTQAQRAEALDYAKSLGMPEDRIFFTEHGNTAHGATFDILTIGTDVLPAQNAGLGTLAANSRVSLKGAIAHEIIGHREAALAGKTHAVDVLEEAQASIRAARFAPGLSSTERTTLLKDAVSRLHKGGYRVSDVRDKLFIHEP